MNIEHLLNAEPDLLTSPGSLPQTKSILFVPNPGYQTDLIHTPSKFQHHAMPPALHVKIPKPVHSQRGLHSNERLSAKELSALFRAAASNQSLVRAKRDVVILSFMVDLKFSSQKLSELTLGDVQQILFEGATGILCRHTNYFLECHPKTLAYLKEWLHLMQQHFDWDLTDIECPLFVSLQLTDTTATGVKVPRKAQLRRDAVSKIYMAIKNRSGVHRCTRELILASRMDDFDHATFDREFSHATELRGGNMTESSSPHSSRTGASSGNPSPLRPHSVVQHVSTVTTQDRMDTDPSDDDGAAMLLHLSKR